MPSTSRRRGSVNHSRSSYYKAFIKYAEVAGVRPRSLHSTRHTFITLAQRCGARKEHVERITHNARGDIAQRARRYRGSLHAHVEPAVRSDALFES